MRSCMATTKGDDYGWGHIWAPTIRMIMVGIIYGRNYEDEYGWGYFFATTIRIIMHGQPIIRMIMIGVFNRPQLKRER